MRHVHALHDFDVLRSPAEGETRPLTLKVEAPGPVTSLYEPISSHPSAAIIPSAFGGCSSSRRLHLLLSAGINRSVGAQHLS